MKDIPAAWQEVLLAIRSVAPSALLAGGALRDWDNEREVKDLDVFVPEGTSEEAVQKAVAQHYPTLNYTLTEEYLHLKGAVSSIMLLSSDALPPLNVISIAEGMSPADRFDGFDFGICQIAYDGTSVTRSLAYEQDQNLAMFTLVNCKDNDAYQRSLVRYERLTEKYASWPLVIPRRLVGCTIQKDCL